VQGLDPLETEEEEVARCQDPRFIQAYEAYDRGGLLRSAQTPEILGVEANDGFCCCASRDNPKTARRTLSRQASAVPAALPL
jgi:hypothetical protein